MGSTAACMPFGSVAAATTVWTGATTCAPAHHVAISMSAIDVRSVDDDQQMTNREPRTCDGRQTTDDGGRTTTMVMIMMMMMEEEDRWATILASTYENQERDGGCNNTTVAAPLLSTPQLISEQTGLVTLRRKKPAKERQHSWHRQSSWSWSCNHRGHVCTYWPGPLHIK